MKRKTAAQSAAVPYIRCPQCQADHVEGTLAASLYVCPRCGHHMPLSAKRRISLTLDRGTMRELFAHILPKNPLDFPEYDEKLARLSQKTGMADAALCATGSIGRIKVVCAALDSRFLMGSMGTAVGEKITLAAEYAHDHRLPLIIFSASGGARMQEGVFSLMQMVKTAGAIKRLSEAGGLYISVLTHPTTGGVTASFASLGDIILAEPGALIGFAGPRVIEQTIRQTLPEGFQRSEFQLERGFVDAIVPRNQMRATLKTLLSLHRR
ncbi:MAG: acetyl-CoA carboxylase, carboxyltransferase subunit beta [Christensenellales bacterium]